MGTYTELNCAFSLKRNTPEAVVDTLAFMMGQDHEEPTKLPEHPLFGTKRWRHMLRCSSADVDAEAEAYGDAGVQVSDGCCRYRVTIRFTLRNYDREIGQFIDWITPHIHARAGDFLGYTRSENVGAVTLLIYPNQTLTQGLPDEIWGERQ